jgi:double-stranded uracil-DNA glycosylase
MPIRTPRQPHQLTAVTCLESYELTTLPDYLTPELELVFIGINPGLYSVQRGHYFARPTSRFWPALSSSRLSARARAALGREVLGPEDDRALLTFGIGFTDVVKVPTRKAAELRPADFRQWAPRLAARLEHYRPRVACFHGVTAYRAFMRYGLAEEDTCCKLGPLTRRLCETRLYLVPNPSPANAHFTLRDQTAWYNRLAEFMEA